MRKLNSENIADVWSVIPTLFTDKLELYVEAIPYLMENYLRHENRKTN